MNIFLFENQKLTLNKESILLVKEFDELWDAQRNRIEGDNRGYDRKRAYREFTYIFLMYDWESPYKNFSEKERHEAALSDSELTDKQFKDDKFKAACKKYQEIQDTPQVKLLKSAYRMIDELRLFYELADLQERDEFGKHILNANQAVTSLANLGKMVLGLEDLEAVVRKQKEAGGKGTRGDVEAGLLD